ncbi:MAG: hypothetical protein J6A47_03205 [Bacilli bacterium]|nr:hypothetical protein [Bacilli bacterium]
MKRKLLLLLSGALLLASCGGSTPSSSSVSSSEGEGASSSLSSQESSQQSTSSSSKESASSSQSSSKATSSQGQDSIEASSEDLDGFIEVAYAPEGEVLTDWTDEMKAIFVKYLGGVIPPFFWAEGLRVSYDNLGILQAFGASSDGIASSYASALSKAGYMAQVVDETNCQRVYGRGLGDGFLISVDGLDQNGNFSVNYDIDYADAQWPYEDIAMGLDDEMYGYTTTVIPAYEYENPQYYFSQNGFGEMDLLCLGASESSVTEYGKILEDNHFQVQAMSGEYEGAYTATSRDKRVVLVYYYDGTGLQILISFGEGESYTTWEDCLYAINDFGKTELRLSGDIADTILEIPTAELYEIDRSVRGALEITAYKSTSFTEKNKMDYIMAMVGTGAYDWDVKGDDYWILAKDKSHAMRVFLEDYVSDTLAVTAFVFTLYDYRIYEGAIVYYGEWPTAMVETIRNSLKRGLAVPSYVNENAVYYAYSDRAAPSIRIEIVDPGEGALASYRDLLTEKYSYTLLESAETSFKAIDRDEVAQISGEMVNGEFVITLGKYYKPDITGNRAKFDFTNKNQLTPGEDLMNKVRVWVNGNFSFKVEQGESSRSVGNTDYLADPLRLYRGQKVTISSADASLAKLEFYVTAVDGSSKREIKNFDASCLSNITIENATFASYNAETGMVRFNVNDNATEVSFTVTTSISSSDAGFGLNGLDVFFAA